MSVCTAGSDVHSTATHVLSLPNETTYRKAINEIRSKMKSASGRRVHIYSFNVHPEQLESAHALLDKEDQRRSMRVTYSDDHNFIVRYMPSKAHQVAHLQWTPILYFALQQLTQQIERPPGLQAIGATTFQVGPKKKQADSAVEPKPNPSGLPSIIIEAGDSESFTQLKIDARLWLEHMPEVQLVILLSIDCPPAQGSLPKTIIQLWRAFLPPNPPSSPAAQQRKACMVWEADWTQTATPLYILLSDIFRGPAPAAYGDNDHAQLDTVAWRQAIIDTYVPTA